MRIIYHIGIYLYLALARLISPFSHKAFLFYSGRKKLISRIAAEISHQKPIIWFHCASVGEFEQARPLIEKIKETEPEKKVLLTFFSPSGYELRKNYEYADWVYYMPMDTLKNAERFLSVVRPERVFFVKYEFWFYFLKTLSRLNIPTFIVSAIFRPNQMFFKWYGGFFRKILKCYSILFVQDRLSKELLSSIGVENVVVSGDTRFDRVYESAKERVSPNTVVEEFAGGCRVFVAGSTWDKDEENLALAMAGLFLEDEFKDVKLIIAPHEVSPSRIKSVEKSFSGFNYLKYTECLVASAELELVESRVMIVDCVGILSGLYRYSKVSYIGGGFGVGIHNILEAATFGVPVIFGPKYEKFREARDLIEIGGAYSYSSLECLQRQMRLWLRDQDLNKKASLLCKEYVKNNIGATAKILKFSNS